MIGKSFIEVLIQKFNPYHGKDGRFTGPGGYASFSANPNTSYGRAAIRREQKVNPLIGAAYGTKRSRGQIQDEKQKKAIAGSVRGLMADYGVKGSKEELTNEIHDYYKYAKSSGKLRVEDGIIKIKRAAYEKAQDIARKAMNRAEYTDTSTETEYKALRSYVRNTSVRISDYDKGNITDFNSYRRQNMGGVKISRNGIPIDSFYQELSGKFPHLFDSSRTSNQADQLQEINDTLSSLKPRAQKYTGSMKEDAIESMTKEIINGYFQIAN